MICRFCMQWSPEEATRCSFCNNLVQASEDATRSGRVTAVDRARLPPVEKSSGGHRRLADLARDLEREPDGYRRDLLRADLVWKIVVGVAVALAIVWQLAGLFGLRCR